MRRYGKLGLIWPQTPPKQKDPTFFFPDPRQRGFQKPWFVNVFFGALFSARTLDLLEGSGQPRNFTVKMTGLLLRNLPYYGSIVNNMVSGLWLLDLSSLTATQIKQAQLFGFAKLLVVRLKLQASSLLERQICSIWKSRTRLAKRNMNKNTDTHGHMVARVTVNIYVHMCVYIHMHMYSTCVALPYIIHYILH